jgi:hypothetical protein
MALTLDCSDNSVYGGDPLMLPQSPHVSMEGLT